jgi:hypothetical protein
MSEYLEIVTQIGAVAAIFILVPLTFWWLWFLGHISRMNVVVSKSAGDLKTEADFAVHINSFLQGELEYRLDDKTRVDILTDTMAIEVDYAKKWYEAVGQSSHYALKTGRQPGIVLILTSPKDEKYLEAAKSAIPKIRVDGKSIALFPFRHFQ